MPTSDRASFTWCKSSYSSDTSNCVEVGSSAETPAVGVRDSKDPDGGFLLFTPSGWRDFLRTF